MYEQFGMINFCRKVVNRSVEQKTSEGRACGIPTIQKRKKKFFLTYEGRREGRNRDLFDK
jgi:hypothetical protein